MNDAISLKSDFTSCDLEQIHIPGSIQPHGLMLIANQMDGAVIGVAGNVEGRLAKDWAGKRLADLIGEKCYENAAKAREGFVVVLGRIESVTGGLNAVAYRSGGNLVVELDDAKQDALLDAAFLFDLDEAVSVFERAPNIEILCRQAAKTFRKLTGYGRVMVYQFIDNDAGVVVGESLDDASSSFMNHHFPASDIPKQARSLYIRNRVRVIPDVNYAPQPIRSTSEDLRVLDLSDSTLRSVSPVHIQYLKNMGVAASASISIIKDGILWGLIACHHHEPREIPLGIRVACQAIAGSLSRQIRAKDEAELYRERLRLRAQEEAAISKLGEDGSLGEFFEKSGGELAALLGADGFAAVQGKDLFTYGNCPDNIDIRTIAEFVRQPASMQPLVTASLSTRLPEAIAYADKGSGLLAVTMSTEIPTILMWFRAEYLQVLEWAGNPHKMVPADSHAILNPRASFEAWSEQVRNKSKPWTHGEVEAASRIVKLMLEHRNSLRIRELNRELTTTLKENENLLKQKDFLLKEVNHRVQNSLQLVAAFLRLQAKASGDENVRLQLDEADKRLNAVALVHRRLYRDDSVELIDLSRYLGDLVTEIQITMDENWRRQFDLDLAPILIATDRAVSVGLLLTELVINVQKYAYEGHPGPVSVKLEQHRGSFRLIVADSGVGKSLSIRSGFGKRMLSAVVDRLKGHIDEEDNRPGLRTVVTAPISVLTT
ncbi:histidine kinase dimerization/phosphoacceptor domain -containing protein [Rhizobium sp. S163]|uniref:histidine kinase dimerization/phosphoacceptor domain -containing protein n=1 Tax=Rhizobium sp. S163 TaxID=3055039 RepID=UPI0025A9573C|nr:histidine kinase dimerization/phosphoacceptor domain -containing protein [Rhizobium sp. S163]MDM9649416.1 histidine kinase dimerization/phosphoacceptor domain -containing protein [Rhizobium sp. S163]